MPMDPLRQKMLQEFLARSQAGNPGQGGPFAGQPRPFPPGTTPGTMPGAMNPMPMRRPPMMTPPTGVPGTRPMGGPGAPTEAERARTKPAEGGWGQGGRFGRGMPPTGTPRPPGSPFGRPTMTGRPSGVGGSTRTVPKYGEGGRYGRGKKPEDEE